MTHESRPAFGWALTLNLWLFWRLFLFPFIPHITTFTVRFFIVLGFYILFWLWCPGSITSRCSSAFPRVVCFFFFEFYLLFCNFSLICKLIPCGFVKWYNRLYLLGYKSTSVILSFACRSLFFLVLSLIMQYIFFFFFLTITGRKNRIGLP